MSAVHDEFGLSYANYFVVPRSILEAMPDEWQERFVGIVRELHAEFDFEPEDPYHVMLRRDGKFIADRLSEYRRPDRAFIDSLRRKVWG